MRRIALLCAVVCGASATAGTAAAQTPRFDVLVFSKTTGFRHTDAIDAGKAGDHGDGRGAELLGDDHRGRDPVHRRDAAPVRGRRDAAPRRRGHPQRGPAHGVRALAAARQGPRRHPRRRQRRPQLGLDDGLARRLAVPQPPERREPVPAGDGQERRPESPRHAGDSRRLGAHRRVVQLHRRAAERPRPRQARREHLRSRRTARRRPTTTRSPGARTSTAAARSTPALGHNGTAWQEPLYRQHIQGAIEWAAGATPGDCGAPRDGIPTDASFDKVTLDDNTENPMEIAVAPGGNVYLVELAGKVKYYNATTRSVRTVGTIPVHRGNENGLLGIALDPGFATNKWLYLFYSAPTPEEQHVSRFTVGADGNIDMASEKVLLKIPHQRIVCCHSAGLDDLRPRRPAAHLHRRRHRARRSRRATTRSTTTCCATTRATTRTPTARTTRAARRATRTTCAARSCASSRRPTARTASRRATSSRPSSPIRPRPSPRSTRWATATRSGSRSTRRPGWVYNGEVGPDANNENANRGPRGYDELNQIRQAGNMGWPYCIADNKAYRDWDVPQRPGGRDVRLRRRPEQHLQLQHRPGQDAGRDRRAAVVAVRAVPDRLPVGDGADRDPDGQRADRDRRPDLPLQPGGDSRTRSCRPYYDDKVFFADWSRDWIATLTLERRGQARGDPALPAQHRVPAPAGHRDGPGRHALRARVGPRLQLRRLGHQPRLRPVPDRLRQGLAHAGRQGERRQGLRRHAADGRRSRAPAPRTRTATR